MPNNSTPYGLVLHDSQNADVAYTKAFVFLGGTELRVGDPVVMHANGHNTTYNLPECVRYTEGASNPITGVVAGVKRADGDIWTAVQNRVPSGTVAIVYVYTNPSARYKIKASNSVTSAATIASAVGNNCRIVYGTPASPDGASGVMLDLSTAATTATLPIRIEEILQNGVNEVATFCEFIVRINNSTEAAGTGAAGI